MPQKAPQKALTLSRKVDECKPLSGGFTKVTVQMFYGHITVSIRKFYTNKVGWCKLTPGAPIHPLFSST
jgi:hypothetical protein